ncbi:MAG: radical SAM family heme chaperone HemW [Tepidiformaceae bacterium]
MKPLSVYVHIPFCTAKCGYCDFNAYAGMDTVKADYAAALVEEVAAWRAALGARTVRTIAFGGGTPGESPAAHIAGVISAVRAAWPVDAGAEVSLEANPGTSGLAGLRALRAAGVTRISFGVQSFDAAELSFLDRIHSAEANRAAIGLARRAGFESVGVDLIYGLPGQTRAAWERNLNTAIALAPDHISAYALTVEDGTPLAARVAAGAVIPLDGDLVAAMYEHAGELLASAGYHHYEISNWALAGHESRHNQAYWTDGDYLGIGAGAHGYIDGCRHENIAHPRAYIDAVRASSAALESNGPAIVSAGCAAPDVAMSDWIALALRRLAGFDAGDFERKFGAAIDAIAGQTLSDCEAAGVIEREGAVVRLSRRGLLLHGEVAVRLIAETRESVGRALPAGPSRLPAGA